MLKKIYYYEQGSVSLKHMLASVESLAWNLIDFDKKRVDKISEFEGNIDYCNLNYNDCRFSLEERLKDKEDMDNLIDELKKHIKSKIDNTLSDEDVEYRY
jgi:hypothetical protein